MNTATPDNLSEFEDKRQPREPALSGPARDRVPQKQETTVLFTGAQNQEAHQSELGVIFEIGATDPLLVGEYRVTGILGYGGMSVVYRGWHAGLHRTVALKRLKRAALSGSPNRDDLTEARLTAQLQHPGIVQIFHIVEHSGHSYLVMEYVEGGTLAQRLRDANLPDFIRVAQILLALAEAIQFAHQFEVLHLDLKPSNVLLTANGQPKIVDFGLGQLHRQGATAQLPAGTPYYMAPEQTWSGGAVGTWTDIYGLGTILYQMLTGRPPCSGSNLDETFAAVRAGRIISVEQLRPDTPRALIAICQRCLHLDPRLRYASAWNLAEDLRRFLAGHPLAVPVRQIAYRLRLWLRRPDRIRDAGLVMILVSGSFTLWCLLVLLLMASNVLEVPKSFQLTRHITFWLTCGYLPGLVIGVFTMLHRLWAIGAATTLSGSGTSLMLAHLLGLYEPDYDLGGLAPNAESLLVANLLITIIFALTWLIQLPALRAWYTLYGRRQATRTFTS